MMIFAQVLPDLDLNNTINKAAEQSGEIFLIVILVVLFGLYKAIELYFIIIPKAKAEIEKQSIDGMNQSKVADGFKSLSVTTLHQQELMSKAVACLEGVQQSLITLQECHNTTHRGISELFLSIDHAVMVFGDRAEGIHEKQAIEEIRRALARGQRILSEEGR